LGEQYSVGHTYFFDIAGLIARWPRVRPKGQRPRSYLWAGPAAPAAARSVEALSCAAPRRVSGRRRYRHAQSRTRTPA
jgi:hypothetical protein